jgi:hypothetical protein
MPQHLAKVCNTAAWNPFRSTYLGLAKLMLKPTFPVTLGSMQSPSSLALREHFKKAVIIHPS